MDGGGGHLKAWMPPDVGTLPEPEGRALVLSLWNTGVTMQNISFDIFQLCQQTEKAVRWPFYFVCSSFLLKSEGEDFVILDFPSKIAPSSIIKF
ncbi:MAG: hypothetical protein XD65_0993 [Caldanaerobacter subterraneus]|nr:MAG: hypothetical protein XD37_0692 [Thermoanaerobacter thermocopriae]KUK34669.1 MAG: hypothetical protein XD65_0993 [Caldanaerobacter subterraneus]MDI3529827.1 hypothetical protein [Thermoanaerobacter sp.]HAA63984.1 hypothetical protein [Thermoanaerobacter sp.]HAA80922.1 hypothetical protein [Thermoanaerobacter sp.]